jgi:hypothetical protein
LIAVFNSYRYSGGSIHAQKIDGSGLPGDPAPTMDSAIDRPNDQGGELIVSWNKSVYDSYANDVIDYYSLWMSYDAPARAKQFSAEMVTQVSKLSGLSEDQTTVMLNTGWSYVGQQDAYHFDQYAINAPTYGDAIEGQPDPITIYQVLAHDTDTGNFWPVAETCSGTSVDNLNPGAPLMLTAETINQDVSLQWSSSNYNDEDLSEYYIYKSSDSGFIPSDELFIGSSSDTLFTDINSPTGSFYYRVTAVDIHLNEGDPSNEAMVSNISAVGDTPTLFAFNSAAPNPFNPSTVIKLDVPRDGNLQVNIYDLRGTKIATLHNGQASAGSHQFNWRGVNDAGITMPSGVYFAQARCGDSVSTLKLTLTK